MHTCWRICSCRRHSINIISVCSPPRIIKNIGCWCSGINTLTDLCIYNLTTIICKSCRKTKLITSIESMELTTCSIRCIRYCHPVTRFIFYFYHSICCDWSFPFICNSSSCYRRSQDFLFVTIARILASHFLLNCNIPCRKEAIIGTIYRLQICWSKGYTWGIIFSFLLDSLTCNCQSNCRTAYDIVNFYWLILQSTFFSNCILGNNRCLRFYTKYHRNFRTVLFFTRIFWESHYNTVRWDTRARNCRSIRFFTSTPHIACIRRCYWRSINVFYSISRIINDVSDGFKITNRCFKYLFGCIIIVSIIKWNWTC